MKKKIEKNFSNKQFFFPFFCEGFFSRLKDHLSEVTLLQLTKSSAIGAAFLGKNNLRHVSNLSHFHLRFLAVKTARLEVKIDFKQNSKVLCHYKNGQIL